MVYVADRYNNRVQVFRTIYVIDCSSVLEGDRFYSPRAIAFDLSSDVHVAVYGSFAVAVCTPTGQFVRHYGLQVKLSGCIPDYQLLILQAIHWLPAGVMTVYQCTIPVEN